jgi:hypothetical protein
VADETPMKRRGVRSIGGELQLHSDFFMKIDEDGNITMGEVSPRLRTDMWSFWVEDAIEAAGRPRVPYG